MDILEWILSAVTDPLFITSIIFWVITFTLLLILRKKRENISIFFPFLVLLRTKLLNKMFQKIGRRGKKGWRVFWTIGVIVSFILMLFALYFFIANLINLIRNPQIENAIVPLIPGVTVSFPMFTEILLPLLFVVTIHEFSHAIAAEVDGVPVKSSGIFGAGIFFIIGYGAFVEVDDFHMNSHKVSTNTRMRISAAGVWSNVLLAGIIFLSLNIFPHMMRGAYTAQTFQIETVMSPSEGGFNFGNIQPGDIVYKINGTEVDYNFGASLSEILNNQTELEYTIGDTLNLTCYNPKTREDYYREVLLGFRPFVGFDIGRIAINDEEYNNTAFRVENVSTWALGGNNYGKIPEDTVIVSINGTMNIDYSVGNTLEFFLTQRKPDYRLNLTSDAGENYSIYVNYSPLYPGAHNFNSIYLGINTEKLSDTAINITYVFRDGNEGGVNEGNIAANLTVVAVNETLIDLSSQTFKEFIATFGAQPGDTLIFKDSENNNYTLTASEVPIRMPVVFIGITSTSYWMPRNFLGRLFGGNFPNIFYNFLMWSWIIAFSMSLFNLLPVTVFDGGRLVKEVVDKIIGTKEWDKHATQKVHYEYRTKEKKQHLQTHFVTKVDAVRWLIPVEGKKSSDVDQYTPQELEFTQTDTIEDGYMDTIELRNCGEVTDKALIEVEFHYEKDLQQKMKKNVMRGISIVAGGIVLANFVISIIKFGNSIFWL